MNLKTYKDFTDHGKNPKLRFRRIFTETFLIFLATADGL